MILRFRPLAWALLCVLMACGGARCDGSKGEAPVRPAAIALPRPDLRLVVVTDPRGYLEPCGCQQRPLGGLDKMATVVAGAREDKVPLLVVSAGDLAFGSELRPEDEQGARTQEQWRAETFAAIWKQIGLAAAAPGPLDLAQPPAVLGGLAERGGFVWLADNAQTKEPGNAPFASARIVDVGGVKVGLLGLSAPGVGSAPAAEGLTLDGELPTLAAAKSEALRKDGAQLVVALVSADRRTARVIAGRGPDVVVMGGLDLEKPLPPVVHERAVLLHAGRQGQYAVKVDLRLKPNATGWEDASEWTRREEDTERTRQLKELRERIASWEKDPKVAPADLETQRARAKELERAMQSGAQPSFEGRWFSASLAELAPEVPGAKEIGSQLDAHDKRVNEHNRVSLANVLPKPAAPGAPSYAGSDSCASCHQQAYDWWKKTKHGDAYATLEKVDKQFNLNCVACHVVGYNQPGGSTVTHVENLKDVGCESCHGPGSLHNARPAEVHLARAVPEATCRGCHTPEHSDRFVYEGYRATLIVPGHGLPADR